MSEDPLHYFVRDIGCSTAHHWDYLLGRTDHALCGQAYENPEWEGEDRPNAVCEACESLLPSHEARWWRSKAELLAAEVESLGLEVEGLQARLATVEKHAENQRHQLRLLNTGPGGPHKRKPKAGRKKAKGTKVPDNSREAVMRRQRAPSGPLAAADISTTWRQPSATRGVRIVSGGLPGLGKRR